MSIGNNLAELINTGVLTVLARLAGPPPPHFPAIQPVGALDFRIWVVRDQPGLQVRLNPERQSASTESNFLLTVMLAASEALQIVRTNQATPRGSMEVDSDSDSDDEGPPPLIRTVR